MKKTHLNYKGLNVDYSHQHLDYKNKTQQQMKSTLICIKSWNFFI
jgi:hypothetical protein